MEVFLRQLSFPTNKSPHFFNSTISNPTSDHKNQKEETLFLITKSAWRNARSFSSTFQHFICYHIRGSNISTTTLTTTYFKNAHISTPSIPPTFPTIFLEHIIPADTHTLHYTISDAEIRQFAITRTAVVIVADNDTSLSIQQQFFWTTSLETSEIHYFRPFIQVSITNYWHRQHTSII